MFGIGGSEILVILIVALLFLGPDKLPDAAKQISKGIRDLKKQSRVLQQTIENDEHIGGAIRDIKSALRGDERSPVRRRSRRRRARRSDATKKRRKKKPTVADAGRNRRGRRAAARRRVARGRDDHGRSKPTSQSPADHVPRPPPASLADRRGPSR